MKNLLKSIKNSLSDENYYSALFIALALPDICGKVEWNVGNKERYTKWCDNYFVGRSYEVYGQTIEPYIKMVTSADLFALRCSMLHEGSAETNKDIKRFLFSVTKNNYIHCNMVNNKLNFDIVHFCNDMCTCVSEWLIKHPLELPIDIKLEITELPY